MTQWKWENKLFYFTTFFLNSLKMSVLRISLYKDKNFTRKTTEKKFLKKQDKMKKRYVLHCIAMISYVNVYYIYPARVIAVPCIYFLLKRDILNVQSISGTIP